jgi:hypothetical protein
MKAYQWFLLGMMVRWTPGLLVLALMLRQHDIGQNSAERFLLGVARPGVNAPTILFRVRVKAGHEQ